MFLWLKHDSYFLVRLKYDNVIYGECGMGGCIIDTEYASLVPGDTDNDVTMINFYLWLSFMFRFQTSL